MGIEAVVEGTAAIHLTMVDQWPHPMGYSNGMMPLAAPAYQPVVVASPVISPQFIDPMPTLYSAAGAEFVTGPDQTGLALNHWRN